MLPDRFFFFFGVLCSIRSGKAATLRGISQEQCQHGSACQAKQTGSAKTPLPPRSRNDRRDKNKCERLADIMARRPNSVKTASLLVRNPPGLGNHTCRGPHGLNPAVNGPQGNEYSGRHTESKDQIHQCGGQQAQRHETSDIHPISQETVYKLAHCISDEQGRSNDSKLCLGKCSRVHDRLFNHIQAKPAYIVYSIAYGGREEHLPPKPGISFIF